MLLATLLFGCHPVEVTLVPHRVPDTGASTLTLTLPAGHTAQRVSIGPHEVALTPAGAQWQATLPALAAGTYSILVDGAETTASLEVYTSELEIHFIDVGQGDAVLVVAPDGWTALVDTGPPDAGTQVLNYLMEQGVNHLNHLVLTHTDADHLGGLPTVLAGPDGVDGTADDFRPDVIYEDGSLNSCSTQTCAQARRAAPYATAPRLGATVEQPGGFTMRIVASGGATLEQLAPEDAQTHNNARSIVTTICLDSWCGLLAGDLTGGGLDTPNIEANLAPALPPMAWVMVPHHGSRSSSHRSLVEATQPRLAVFSLGSDNSHCHPAPEVLQRWDETARVVSTGHGQRETGACSTTSWPDQAQAGCGHIVIRKGPRREGTVQCAASTHTF
jgi:competence protein ComEC